MRGTRPYRFPTTPLLFGVVSALFGGILAQILVYPLPVGVIGGCVGMYLLFFLTMGVEMPMVRYFLMLLII